MTRRLVVPGEPLTGEVVRLSGAPLHHLGVLRLRPGDQLELTDGQGLRRQGTLESLSRQRAVVRLGRVLPPLPAPPSELVLLYGLSRGRRTAWVLQKATELGVDRILPVICRRSVCRPARGEDKLRRWQEIVAQACRQSGRDRLPRLAPPASLAELELPPPDQGEVRLVAHPGGAPAARAAELVRPGAAGRLVLAVGPEGGFGDGELDLLGRRGFVPLALGPLILRTETAAVAFLSIVAYLAGRL